MEKAVYMEKQLYDKINQVAFSNEIEQLMLFGGRIKDNSVNLDSDTIKWFSKNELVFSSFYSSSRKSKETGHAAGSGVIELGQGILLSFRA